MVAWDKTFVGRIAANFPQYDFLNGGVGGYSPSNYLNTARMALSEGVDFDEVIVFIDISDAQDEAAFFRDIDASGAVAIPERHSFRPKLVLESAHGHQRAFSAHQLHRGVLRDELWSGSGSITSTAEITAMSSTMRSRPGPIARFPTREPFETGYAPLGLEGGIAKEKAKMDLLWQELAKRNIPISVVVYPYPPSSCMIRPIPGRCASGASGAKGSANASSRCFRGFFAVKDAVPEASAGLLVFEVLHLRGHPLQRRRQRSGC